MLEARALHQRECIGIEEVTAQVPPIKAHLNVILNIGIEHAAESFCVGIDVVVFEDQHFHVVLIAPNFGLFDNGVLENGRESAALT